VIDTVIMPKRLITVLNEYLRGHFLGDLFLFKVFTIYSN